MEYIHTFIDLLSNYTFRNVIIGSSLLGLVSGVLSVFIVLRNESLLSDALSHSVLPGIAIAFMLTGYKDPIILSIGALVMGAIATWAIAFIAQSSIIKKDSAMAIVLSTFFGLGIVFLTFIARSGNSQQAGLESYLLGSAATLLESEVVFLAVISGILLSILLLLYKELKLFCFDTIQAFHLGFSSYILNWILLSCIVVLVVVGLKLVGTVLMAALLIAPAVVGRFWSHSFLGVVVLSGLFGMIGGISGALLSISSLALPTGPAIVLSLFALVVFSLVFGTSKGVVRRFLKN